MAWSDLDDDQRLAAMRVLSVSLARNGDPDEGRRAELLAWMEPHYPAPRFPLNQELCRLLVRLKSPIVLDPSKFVDEKYRFIALTLSDGSQAAGSLESEDDERIVLKPNPLAAETVEIGKSQVARREISTVSPMPGGLLNALKEEQVLDLLAFIESGGNPQAANFQP